MKYRLVLAGADTLAGTLINSVAASVRLQNAQWMLDDETAYHLTLTLDGWSNDRMESIYSWNIIFPDRRVILLKADDLSSMAHRGENLARMCSLHLLFVLCSCVSAYCGLYVDCSLDHQRDRKMGTKKVCSHCH